MVLVAEGEGVEVDFLVDSADEAVQGFCRAGGKVVEGTFDISIGRCAVVEDPWKNRLVVLDMTKGPLKTDAQGNVVDSPDKDP